jgi:hypothetical protein
MSRKRFLIVVLTLMTEEKADLFSGTIYSMAFHLQSELIIPTLQTSP